MPFSCRICIDCKSNVATTAMFLIQLHPITDRHIQPNHASYCRSCAQCRYDSDSKSKAEPKYFGYLIDMEIFEYLHQTKDGSPAEILHQCGIFLHKKSRNLAALLQHLEQLTDGKDLYHLLDRLKNDGERDYADYRRWKNLDGDITGHSLFTSKQINEMKDLEDLLLREVEEKCFPTEKYAKIAMKNATKADVTKKQVLIRSKLYVMGRFRGLSACQVPHQDDWKYNVNIICIAKCDGGKYPFLYHEGSHFLAFESGQGEYPQLNSQREKPLHAEKGDCIVFFTPLIHRGGPSSMAGINSIPENTLTDLVFAYHCYHFGLPSGSETGRGKIKFSHLKINNKIDEHTFEPLPYSVPFSEMRQRARHGFMMKILGKRMTSRNAKGFDGNIAV